MSGRDSLRRFRQRRRLLAAAALAALLPAASVRAAAKARVVVAGGGFAGAACAFALRRLDPSIEVAVVDPDATYVTGPMSNAVLAGWRTLDSISLSRSGFGRAGITHVRDRIAAIDARRRRVDLRDNGSLAFDRLVVAPGIRFLADSPRGYDDSASQRMPHAWIAGAQTALLAAQLRAMDDGGTVAISVPDGLMRCPPGPFERATVIAAWLQRNKPRSKVLILDANNHFPRQDAFSAAWQTRYPGLVEWIPSTAGGAVERVDADRMTLYTSRGAQRVAVANVIPRQAPAQIALDAGLCSGDGWCPVVAESFESTRLAGVHVIGDACIAGAMPKSASAAHSQALRCARAIVAALHGAAAPHAELDSVCYSLLAADAALAIHGRFAVAAGEIRSLPLPAPARQPSARDEASRAANWYRAIVSDTFGAAATVS